MNTAKFLVVPSVAILANLAFAQTLVTLPSQFATSWGDIGVGTGTGLGTVDSFAGSRAQYLYTPSFPVGTVITAIGFRHDSDDDPSVPFTADVEISMSSTPVIPGSGMASMTYASNHGSDVTLVHPFATVSMPGFAANRSTGEFAMIPLTTPFIFGSNGEANLCVDVSVTSTTNSSSSGSGRFRIDRCLGNSSNGSAVSAGLECGGGTAGSSNSGGIYVPGSTFDVTLSGAEPNMLSLLFTSFNMRDAFGVPVPIDFSLFFGAGPGCDLLVDPAIIVSLMTDGAGDVSVTGIPAPPAGTIPYVGFQWLYLVTPTATNPSGIELSDVRQIVFGPRTCANEYVYDLFAVDADADTIQEGGAVLMLETF